MSEIYKVYYADNESYGIKYLILDTFGFGNGCEMAKARFKQLYPYLKIIMVEHNHVFYK